MRRVILSAGHSNKEGRDNGAIFGEHTEGVLTARLRSDLAFSLKAEGIEVITDFDDSDLKDSLDYFKPIVIPSDIAIEFHFNNFATNLAVGGTEVVIPATPSSFEKDLAMELSLAMARSLGIRNRGVLKESDTPRKRLGWMRLDCETVLPEVCFLSSASDMELYYKHYWRLLSELSKIIEYFSKRP